MTRVYLGNVYHPRRGEPYVGGGACRIKVVVGTSIVLLTLIAGLLLTLIINGPNQSALHQTVKEQCTK